MPDWGTWMLGAAAIVAAVGAVLKGREDRGQLKRLIGLLNRLTAQVEHLGQALDRVERDRVDVAEALITREQQIDAASAEVADALSAAKTKIKEVAADLEASHLRADEVAESAPGSAADAASQSARDAD
jgi:ABC-type transporter Mla subunit MlaD